MRNNKKIEVEILECGGLTDEENKCMALLLEAFSVFVSMEQTHPSDLPGVIDAVHRIQDTLGMRCLRRLYPKTWRTKKK